MPSLALTTNVQVPDTRAFVLEFSKLAAETLKKPEQYISINYSYDPNLTFAGTFDPALLLVITSLDNINPEVNDVYSKAFFSYFEKTLGVPGNRGYITFYDPGRSFLGHQGTTFGTIFGK
ncbi:hypothetical protein JAAARDRAFT_33186 [Jaapia argillacea MUCL 33604]|uniref:L-dopachrome isomerase n=1 Tax=Jaapia argillacea MUCL 33604 TaxID=933084 RepID=A0A067Q0C4_9AGAM|nr:hypothetical protein JAAARDRAFT_33186 [Jaapia argillacea MUCL 33604]